MVTNFRARMKIQSQSTGIIWENYLQKLILKNFMSRLFETVRLSGRKWKEIEIVRKDSFN